MRRCVERAEGNPLFLEQLLRSRATDQEGHLPPSVHGVVLARLDRLAQPDRRAIETAAILGQRLDPAICGRSSATRAMIVASWRGATGSAGRARDLVRARLDPGRGVYASLTHERRAQLHRAAAALFAERDPAVHAEHLERAGDDGAPAAYLAAARRRRPCCTWPSP